LTAIVGLFLFFAGLGKDDLWADEGDTAVFAANITKYGIPKAWDGVTFIDSDKGARLNHDLILVTSPWLQYYATAGSFLVFGKNTFSARFPFAIAGWLTVLLAYRLVLKTTANRWAAFCAAAILIGSVQFLLYGRQCRYYALSMLLTLLLISIFLKMKSARQCALFALTGILLFHAHPISAAPLIALGLLTIVYPPFFNQRRWFWIAAPAIIALTAPSIVFGGSGYAESMGGVQSIPQFIGRMTQYLVECASVTPLLGVAILAGIWAIRNYRVKKIQTPNTRINRQAEAIVIFAFATLICYALVIAGTQSSDSLWRIGIRYTTAILPLLAISAAVLIAKISAERTIIVLSLTAALIFTKFAQLTPWIIWGKSVTTFDGKEIIEAHLPNNLVERFLNTRQQFAFLSDLFQSNPGTIAKVSDFLRGHAEPTDKVITNYEWEPLYFHTGLPQGLKILPDYPIYRAAKSKGLPDYVFDVDQVRWVIWRPVWDGFQEYFAGTVQQEIAERGGKIERIAQVPETLWENRENIHFRRFPGDRYLFHDPETFPLVSIFRVSWPGTY
jgi:4-amino-4-deoxy-L-arabinose transferase and related glycosyltransferases of PMT family